MKTLNKILIATVILTAVLVVFVGGDDQSNVTTPTRVGGSSAPRGDDLENARRLGELAVRTGLAVEYDVSGWNRRLDLSISSLLPGDARNIATAVCGTAREGRWDQPWTVRVFLAVGDRPAAVCRTN